MVKTRVIQLPSGINIKNGIGFTVFLKLCLKTAVHKTSNSKQEAVQGLSGLNYANAHRGSRGRTIFDC
jgi:hypothetical protein